MPTLRLAVLIFSLSMMLNAVEVLGQNYPNKTIRIVTSDAGGTGDTVSRLMLPGLSGLGQQVIVENRVAVIARETVMRAPPDGYTVLVDGIAFWIAPLLQKMSYDPVTDFLPISSLITQPNILVVHPSLPVHSVKELIALAKARPGELNYGTAAIGGSTHLAAELFKSMAHVNIVTIPYKGAAAANIALVSGEVQLSFTTVSTVAPHIKSGRLKALAVTSAQPTRLLPGLPTVADSGLPGYESGNTSVMFAPAKTPDAVIARLGQEVVRALNAPDIKEKLFNNGSEVVGSSPEQLASAMKADIARMAKVIKDAGIKIE